MGRVARYKKIKSIDPFASSCSWTLDVGAASALRRTKRRSKMAQRLKEQKNRRRGGGNDDGYDLPPEGEDEFDGHDLIASVKKQSVRPFDWLGTSKESRTASDAWTRSITKVDLLGVKRNADGMCFQKKGSAGGSKLMPITAKTPTRDIIAACNDRPLKKGDKQEALSTAVTCKQEKQKEFFRQKKQKKRKRRNVEEDYQGETELAPKLELVQKSSPSLKGALIARSAIGDQVERPPTFSTLPRGALTLNKKKQKEVQSISLLHSKNVDANERDEQHTRIQKEQQALEAMRERVMRQYAILRESRR